MTTQSNPAVVVTYQGPGTGSELWGGTQANFLVSHAGGHSKEVAVILNDAAAAHLAEALGAEDSPTLRRELARKVGEAAIRHRVATTGRPDSLVMVSKAMLDATPGLVEAAR